MTATPPNTQSKALGPCDGCGVDPCPEGGGDLCTGTVARSWNKPNTQSGEDSLANDLLPIVAMLPFLERGRTLAPNMYPELVEFIHQREATLTKSLLAEVEERVVSNIGQEHIKSRMHKIFGAIRKEHGLEEKGEHERA